MTNTATSTVEQMSLLRLTSASNSQAIGCEDRFRNDLYCVGWGVKLYTQSNYCRLSSLSHSPDGASS